jgi:hypothetical protein
MGASCLAAHKSARRSSKLLGIEEREDEIDRDENGEDTA